MSGFTAYQGITQVASGGGALHLNASSGDFYAEVQNKPDEYGYGCGMGGYSFYGGKDSVYSGPFHQSIDVYINTAWAPGYLGGTPAFWIDMAPYHADPNNYGAEQNFQVSVPGTGIVNISATGQSDQLATITESGWYTFDMVFRQGTNANELVETDLSVYDSAKSLLGTTTLQANSPGGPFLNSDLCGNGYVWLSVWQNGFAGDVIAIDNLVAGPVPEPATLSLLVLGGLAALRRRNK